MSDPVRPNQPTPGGHQPWRQCQRAWQDEARGNALRQPAGRGGDLVRQGDETSGRDHIRGGAEQHQAARSPSINQGADQGRAEDGRQAGGAGLNPDALPRRAEVFQIQWQGRREQIEAALLQHEQPAGGCQRGPPKPWGRAPSGEAPPGSETSSRSITGRASPSPSSAFRRSLRGRSLEGSSQVPVRAPSHERSDRLRAALTPASSMCADRSGSRAFASRPGALPGCTGPNATGTTLVA